VRHPSTEFCRVAKEPGTIAPCFAILAPLSVIPALNFAGRQKNWEPLSPVSPSPPPERHPGTEFCRLAKELGTTVPCFAIPAPLSVIPALNFAGWQKNWEPLLPVSPSPPLWPSSQRMLGPTAITPGSAFIITYLKYYFLQCFALQLLALCLPCASSQRMLGTTAPK